MNDCPCGLEKDYSDCCEPLIKGIKKAETPEALMRSRYTAYVKGEVDYIVGTFVKSKQDGQNKNAIRKWSKESVWKKLEIIHTEKGGPDDTEGYVEFVAHYLTNGNRQSHHERAHFLKEDGEWYFNDADYPQVEQYVRESPKTGRNDPCPCGSGKKYKKCCLATA